MVDVINHDPAWLINVHDGQSCSMIKHGQSRNNRHAKLRTSLGNDNADTWMDIHGQYLE